MHPFTFTEQETEVKAVWAEKHHQKQTETMFLFAAQHFQKSPSREHGDDIIQAC